MKIQMKKREAAIAMKKREAELKAKENKAKENNNNDSTTTGKKHNQKQKQKQQKKQKKNRKPKKPKKIRKPRGLILGQGTSGFRQYLVNELQPKFGSSDFTRQLRMASTTVLSPYSSKLRSITTKVLSSSHVRRKPKIAKGARDFGPKQMAIREIAFNAITQVSSHITYHTPHITHHTSHITHHTSYIIHHTSHSYVSQLSLTVKLHCNVNK